MMPISVSLTCAVLIGWPIAKVFGAALSRPRWREFKELEKGLALEPWFDANSARLVEKERLDAFGGRTNLAAPVIVIVGCLSLAVRALRGHKSPSMDQLRSDIRTNLAAQYEIATSHPIFGDGRLWRLTELSIDLAFLRDPVTCVLTGMAFLLMTPMLVIAYGTVVFRAPLRKIFLNAMTFTAAQLSSAEGIKIVSAR